MSQITSSPRFKDQKIKKNVAKESVIPRSTRLPVYKIKQMMKAGPNVVNIGGDSAYLTTMATELFIELLMREALEKTNRNEIDYKQIAEVVHEQEKYTFLREIIPQKITVRRYKELLKEAEDLIPEEDLAFYLG